ncbi:MAG: LacI family DNA-binding transcriptional regulator [Candidatus Cyclobacteriaceae bacterium M2_1C_046]
MKKEVTIYDIAEGTGFSPSTVSRALNDHVAVSKATKKLIMDRANSLGYRSNIFASRLRTSKTNTIGVIVPRLNSLFMSSVIAGIEKVANEEGFNILINQSLESYSKEVANSNTMFSSRIDGLLVSLAANTENIDHFKPFIEKNIPLVFFDRVYEDANCVGVIIDNISAAYKATTHLIEQGCRTIVHVTGNLKRNVYSDRCKGFKYALIDNHLPYNDASVFTCDLNEEAGKKIAEEILNLNQLPDGVFFSNDTCAVHFMKHLQLAGVKIPDDVAVVGFNNDPISKIIEPNLTTIDYPGYEMGEVAVRNLINLMNGLSGSISTNTITLRSDLIVRQSSLKGKLAKAI